MKLFVPICCGEPKQEPRYIVYIKANNHSFRQARAMSPKPESLRSKAVSNWTQISVESLKVAAAKRGVR